MIALLLYGLHLQAQIRTESVRVYYRVGQSRLEPDFHGNDTVLADFMQRLRQVTGDRRNRNFNFRIKSYTSPEGPLSINRQLYVKRTAAFLDYLREGGISLPSHTGLWQEEYYNWKELHRWVEGSDMPHKKETLDILQNIPEWERDDAGRTTELRKEKLMELADGEPFRYMLRHFFPEMRYSSMMLFYETSAPGLTQQAGLPETLSASLPESLEAIDGCYPAAEPKDASKNPWYLALKTNLLYDVLAVPNIGVDIYLGRQWSLAANWMYAWWKTDKRHRYWRTYGGDVEVRRWLGRKAKEKPLQGHHLGVYGQMGTYDFEWGGRGYLGDKWSYGAGLSYGYSHPITYRLNMDFTIGIGYLGGEYKEYLPIDDCYVWQATKQRHWFGPTKAEVSLVWLIGHGNVNRKGGRQ